MRNIVGTSILPPPRGTEACRDYSLRSLQLCKGYGGQQELATALWRCASWIRDGDFSLTPTSCHKKHFRRGSALQDVYSLAGESQRLPMLKGGLVFFLLEIVLISFILSLLHKTFEN